MIFNGKIGRNDPCPCGSGKKFKKCCFDRDGRTNSMANMDPLWQSVSKATGGLSLEILKFAGERFGVEIIEEAWQEFMFDDTELLSGSDSFHLPIFCSWFSYNWTPDPFSETCKIPPELLEGTVAQAFLRKMGKKLDPLAVRYIEECHKAVFSFYDILSLTPGTGIRVRDIFTGEEIDILDQLASSSASPGKILFGSVVRIDHLTLLDSSAPYLIPVTMKPDILALRGFIQERFPTPSRQDLAEYDFEMLDLYHDIMERLRNPVPPTLLNTDDELVVFHEIVYEIDSPRQAFDALKTLSVVESEEKMLESAAFDEAGNLTQVRISWSKLGNKIHSTWENTVLGNIKIEGKTLTIQTNSDNRAKTVREMVESRLPGCARLRSDSVTDQKEFASKSREMEEPSSGSPPEPSPEVKAAMKEFVQAGILQWPHKSVPMLGGKTPLEAIQSGDGRDLVESLLLDMEQREIGPGMLIDPKIMTKIRKTLGLSEKPFGKGPPRTS